jgi:raffinose/stachyose/melibiose transport system substrate-binding protein
MTFRTRRRGLVAATAIAAGALALSACSSGSLGSSDSPSATASGGGAAVEITFLVDNSDQTYKPAKALADAFNATKTGVTVNVETRPQGADGDNIVKTKLATGDMADVFQYNSGSLLQALDPAKNLVPLTDEPYMSSVLDGFKPAVTTDGQVYGVPFGTAMGGGILYNKDVFSKLGLSVPKTWDEFQANNAKIKAAGIDPVIQSYGDTWTSQLFVLADYYNVNAANPDWAQQYTANDPNAKYTKEPAIQGFQRLQEVHDKGYVNKDFASIKLDKALNYLVSGKGAQYPMLTFAVASYVGADPSSASKIGFFAQPGDDAATNGLTAWTSSGLYVPTTTEGDKLDAVKKFLAFVATPAACEAQSSAAAPTGPYYIKDCTLPADLPAAVQDLQSYFTAGNNSPALEFLSPVKGPNLEKITVEVGSGIRSAEDGAALYDEDVKKQAQQLGLPGW